MSLETVFITGVKWKLVSPRDNEVSVADEVSGDRVATLWLSALRIPHFDSLASDLYISFILIVFCFAKLLRILIRNGTSADSKSAETF